AVAPLRQRLLLGLGGVAGRPAGLRQPVWLPPPSPRGAGPHPAHPRTLRGRDRGGGARGAARVPSRRGRDPDRVRGGEEPDPHLPRRATHRRQAGAADGRAPGTTAADAGRGARGGGGARRRGTRSAGVIILLTNDDGIHAPALRRLREELGGLGRVV